MFSPSSGKRNSFISFFAVGLESTAGFGAACGVDFGLSTSVFDTLSTFFFFESVSAAFPSSSTTKTIAPTLTLSPLQHLALQFFLLL